MDTIIKADDYKSKEQESVAIDNKNGLYIKLKSREDERFEDIKDQLSIFSANSSKIEISNIMPVYIYFTETKKLSLAPKYLWVVYDEKLHSKLEEIIGKENVAVKS